MTDRDNKEVFVGDIIACIYADGNLPRGAKWRIVDFGIEPSTMKPIAIIKYPDKGYIVCLYQAELMCFRKVVE